MPKPHDPNKDKLHLSIKLRPYCEILLDIFEYYNRFVLGDKYDPVFWKWWETIAHQYRERNGSPYVSFFHKSRAPLLDGGSPSDIEYRVRSDVGKQAPRIQPWVGDAQLAIMIDALEAFKVREPDKWTEHHEHMLKLYIKDRAVLVKRLLPKNPDPMAALERGWA